MRTTEYQRALMRGNGNANTDVPTHTMGYAIDIGLKYAWPETATALRRALEEMRAAGDVYFIAEANQLTLHIVPAPARIPHFEALYQRTVAEAAQKQAPPPASSPAAQPQSAGGSPLAGLWSWIANLF